MRCRRRPTCQLEIIDGLPWAELAGETGNLCSLKTCLLGQITKDPPKVGIPTD
ncbi:hypothetical protein HPP92_005957 [Vanilla planifolia]|uniref:Uncharacterized protein n=1 Tax=Vanilla planifolia TaxID=51239 RepID=A0A835RJG7_VANPL|nr:hypothetical protein HPP92_005957 [Vanilla planifolia]